MEALRAKFDFADAYSAHFLLLPVTALAIGVLSYGAFWQSLALSILFPVLLFHCESRWQALGTALFYHLGASQALAMSAGQYYGGDLFFGMTIWTAGNTVNALIYAAFWHKSETIRLCTIPLAMLAVALPPLGVLGWTSPLAAAGVVYPGTGVAGLFFLLGLYTAIASRYRFFLKAFIALSIWTQFTYQPAKDEGWEGISTQLGQFAEDPRQDYQRQISLLEKIRISKKKIVVLPENVVASGWTEVSQKLWAQSLGSHKTALLGAKLIEFGDQSSRYNVLVAVTSSKVSLYKQRQPIPFSMWQPFTQGGYEASWFENPLLEVAGQKVAPLICYEAFLVWPIVQSALLGAERIVVVSNFWWARGKTIPTIQRSLVRAWSRLFSIPYTLAINT